MNARDAGALFHLSESAPQNRRHHENVGYAVAGKHFGQYLGAAAPSVVSHGDHYLIASGLIGEPTAPVIGRAGATNRNS
jgi:hypothetical protein